MPASLAVICPLVNKTESMLRKCDVERRKGYLCSFGQTRWKRVRRSRSAPLCSLISNVQRPQRLKRRRLRDSILSQRKSSGSSVICSFWLGCLLGVCPLTLFPRGFLRLLLDVFLVACGDAGSRLGLGRFAALLWWLIVGRGFGWTEF